MSFQTFVGVVEGTTGLKGVRRRPQEKDVGGGRSRDDGNGPGSPAPTPGTRSRE